MTLTQLAEKHNLDPVAFRLALQEWIDGQEPIAWTSPDRSVLHRSTKDTVYGSHTIPLIARPSLLEEGQTNERT